MWWAESEQNCSSPTKLWIIITKLICEKVDDTECRKGNVKARAVILPADAILPWGSFRLNVVSRNKMLQFSSSLANRRQGFDLCEAES